MKRKILLLIVLCIKTIVLMGQAIVCSKNISKEQIPFDEVLIAINMYREKHPPNITDYFLLLRDPLILVDFLKKNNLNKFRIYPSFNVWTPIFRQPDCIIRIDTISIFYLYTSEYKNPKDSLFLNILEQETSKALHATIRYNWENMTLEVVHHTPWTLTFYSPPLKEYVFQDGALVEVNNILELKMFYEDTYIPPHHPNRYRLIDPRYIRGVHDRR